MDDLPVVRGRTLVGLGLGQGATVGDDDGHGPGPGLGGHGAVWKLVGSHVGPLDVTGGAEGRGQAPLIGHYQVQRGPDGLVPTEQDHGDKHQDKNNGEVNDDEQGHGGDGPGVD